MERRGLPQTLELKPAGCKQDRVISPTADIRLPGVSGGGTRLPLPPPGWPRGQAPGPPKPRRGAYIAGKRKNSG